MVLLKSYFGFPLATGGKIIGWTGFVYSILTVANIFFEEFYYYEMYDPNDDANETTTEGNKTIADMEKDELLTPSVNIPIVLIICLTYEISNAASSLLLIVGIKKREHLFLLPWLIIFGLTFICTPFVMLDAIFYLTMTFMQAMIPLTSLSYSIMFGVFICSWFTVFTLYKQFKSDFLPYKDLSERQLIENSLELNQNEKQSYVVDKIMYIKS